MAVRLNNRDIITLRGILESGRATIPVDRQSDWTKMTGRSIHQFRLSLDRMKRNGFVTGQTITISAWKDAGRQGNEGVYYEVWLTPKGREQMGLPPT